MIDTTLHLPSESAIRNPQSAIRSPSWVRFFAITSVIVGLLVPTPSHAQIMTGGWVLHLFGMVQVEPGSNVVTMDVKKEQIRFVIHNVRCSDQNFSPGRFYSDTTNREPGLHMKGPDHWLDTLLKERPGKRVLKLIGRYYPDSRLFIIDDLSEFHEERKKEF
jgi:hypothetical protein